MLITGVAGVPGYNAFHYFRSLYGEQVIGVRQPSMWPLQIDGIVPCDVENLEEVDRLWNEYRFASVLNSAGSCRLKSCELDPEKAHRVNVVGTENVMSTAARYGARVIHLSIDLVFAGRHSGRYAESDQPDPVTVYGLTMVKAEQQVTRWVPDACILRISLPMGISFNGHAGAIDWIASRFKQNKPATLYFDEVRTPKYTDCMNRLFHDVMTRSLHGIYHAGGTRALSLFEIAQIVNVAGGYRPELLRGCMRAEAGPVPPRAGNVTLDSSKLVQELGYQPFDPWPLDDDLVPTHDRWHFDSHSLDHSQDLIQQLLYQNPIQPGLVPPNRNELWGKARFV
jgi:dTDP-4-dehydrorhamnose reductase